MDREELHRKAVEALVELMDHAWDAHGYGRIGGAVYLANAIGLDAERIGQEARQRVGLEDDAVTPRHTETAPTGVRRLKER